MRFADRMEKLTNDEGGRVKRARGLSFKHREPACLR